MGRTAQRRPEGFGEGQAEVLAQGAALVCGAEQPAPLKLGDHQIDEVSQPGRQPRRQDAEAVGTLVVELVLQDIDDLRGRADNGEVAPCGGDGRSIRSSSRPQTANQFGPADRKLPPDAIQLATNGT